MQATEICRDESSVGSITCYRRFYKLDVPYQGQTEVAVSCVAGFPTLMYAGANGRKTADMPDSPCDFDKSLTHEEYLSGIGYTVTGLLAFKVPTGYRLQEPYGLPEFVETLPPGYTEATPPTAKLVVTDSWETENGTHFCSTYKLSEWFRGCDYLSIFTGLSSAAVSPGNAAGWDVNLALIGLAWSQMFPIPGNIITEAGMLGALGYQIK